MDDLGFPRTPDRSVKLLETCVRYPRSVETSMGARGPDFLGGSATSAVVAHPLIEGIHSIDAQVKPYN